MTSPGPGLGLGLTQCPGSEWPLFLKISSLTQSPVTRLQSLTPHTGPLLPVFLAVPSCIACSLLARVPPHSRSEVLSILQARETQSICLSEAKRAREVSDGSAMFQKEVTGFCGCYMKSVENKEY